MTELVTVIIPAYNRAKTLGRAIDSVLTQSFKDFKLLIVDDGSSDETLQIAQSYQDSRVRCIVHSSNMGSGAARNTGIQEATTKWLAFLDSDDFWHADKLRTQMDFIEQHPNIMGCTTGYFHVRENNTKQIIPSARQAEHRQILFHDILHMGTTLLVRRAAFERLGGFDPALSRGQDNDWLLRLTAVERLFVVPHPLAWVFQHTQRSAERLENSRIIMLEKHAADYARYGYLFAHRKIARMWADVAYQYEREGNRSKMREYAMKSLFSFPLQAPGIYLILLDALTGLRIKSLATGIKKKVIK